MLSFPSQKHPEVKLQHPIANIHWIIEKAREFQKNIYFYFIDYAKAFDCVDQAPHESLWYSLTNGQNGSRRLLEMGHEARAEGQ